METSATHVILQVIIPILTAVVGGWVGAYFGSKYRERQDTSEKEKVRNIAIKALNIIKSYSAKPYTEAENEFNNSFSIAEKRTIIVALHKLGIPIGIPSNEKFNVKKIHFIDSIIDSEVIDDIILQIKKGYCDNLFYIDPDPYFADSYTLLAKRNAGKKYVLEVLAKSKVDTTTKQLIEPIDFGTIFSLGELKSIQVLRDQVRDQMYFDKTGMPIKEKIESLIKDIDLGLWDMYLLWSFEAYQNVKEQNKMGQFISNIPMNVLPQNTGQKPAEIVKKKESKKLIKK